MDYLTNLESFPLVKNNVILAQSLVEICSNVIKTLSTGVVKIVKCFSLTGLNILIKNAIFAINTFVGTIESVKSILNSFKT
jgi:hypothetical protein